jgi:alanine racemase
VIISRELEAARVEMLGVALIEEALELRNAGIQSPILVLGGSYQGAYELMVRCDLRPAVFQQEHLVQLARAARAVGRRAKAHLKFDSGMGRIGVLPEELDSFLKSARSFPELELEGILSHLASAELEDERFTQEQIRRFKEAHLRMNALGFRPAWRHLSNSAGVMHLPEARDGLELNMIRPGMLLYGLYPAPWLRQIAPLRPVLAWKTGVVHLKKVPSGTPISYGSTWRAPRESVIATAPVGYADGYSRKFSNTGQMLVRGSRAPVVGRVCMDMCMMDVTQIPEVQVGDEVVLLGRQGSEEISAEELAGLAQTINYEVICGLGARVPRIPRDAR